MSEQSSIEWTDATWNPVRGCVKVSPGCAHCYAEAFAERFRAVKGHPYEQGFDLRLVPEKLTEPLSWKKPRRVFVNSMSDLFQDGVSETFIMSVFSVMEQCPQHTFQVLTKRAERMRDVVAWLGRKWADDDRPYTWPLPNVWLGVSVENQHFADERIPLLLQTPAAVRFISAEPLLGPVDVGPYLSRDQMFPMPGFRDPLPGLNWVIDGAESGAGARDYRLAWSLALQYQCAVAGVAYFRKQIGARPIVDVVDELTRWRCPSEPLPDRSGYRLTLRDRKGGDPAEWPEGLRVREFPNGQDHA